MHATAMAAPSMKEVKDWKGPFSPIFVGTERAIDRESEQEKERDASYLYSWQPLPVYKNENKQ